MQEREKGLEAVPAWESRLWFIIGKGDGLSCPLYQDCRSRICGGWCPSEHLDQLIQMADYELYDPKRYEFIRNDRYCAILCLLEKLAMRYLESVGTLTPQIHLKLFSLFEERNKMEVRTVPLKGCHGALWKLQDGWLVHLRASENSAMKSYILFHEVFHVLAHSSTNPIFDKIYHRGKFNEMLADFFSISLLLPRKLAKDALIMFHDVDSISSNYNVPQPFVYLRLKRMGLI